jgi:predicted benzoate:H+ symporter BenE
METLDVIVLILVISAVVMAIFSGALIDMIGELPLLIIEVLMFVGIVFIAVFGQSLSQSKSE